MYFKCLNIVPSQVTGLECPISPDGPSVLTINWGEPSTNADVVNDYLVVVERYVQLPGSQTLETRPLATPFRQEVESGESLMATVTLGIGVCELVVV